MLTKDQIADIIRENTYGRLEPDRRGGERYVVDGIDETAGYIADAMTTPAMTPQREDEDETMTSGANGAAMTGDQKVPLPNQGQFARFLQCFNALSSFEAAMQVVRGYGAFNDADWPNKPDPDVIAVLNWMEQVIGGLGSPVAKHPSNAEVVVPRALPPQPTPMLVSTFRGKETLAAAAQPTDTFPWRRHPGYLAAQPTGDAEGLVERLTKTAANFRRAAVGTTLADNLVAPLLDEAALALRSANSRLNETARFKAGLEIIKEAGAIHGGAWCVAQAVGYLEDLDFDQWPETGKPPALSTRAGEEKQ